MHAILVLKRIIRQLRNYELLRGMLKSNGPDVAEVCMQSKCSTFKRLGFRMSWPNT